MLFIEREDINEQDDDYSINGQRREGNRIWDATADSMWHEYSICTRKLKRSTWPINKLFIINCSDIVKIIL